MNFTKSYILAIIWRKIKICGDVMNEKQSKEIIKKGHKEMSKLLVPRPSPGTLGTRMHNFVIWFYELCNDRFQEETRILLKKESEAHKNKLYDLAKRNYEAQEKLRISHTLQLKAVEGRATLQLNSVRAQARRRFRMKVLNLYAGIGGNRKLWKNVKVVAVENDINIAQIYQTHFPSDDVIVTDAHEFLLNNFQEFDFIWSSPPCQTHSSFRKNICVRYRGTKPIYPDMNLYQEIFFLKHYFNGKWVVENVKPYYKPLMTPSIVLQRHNIWSNFDIPDFKGNKSLIRKEQIPQLQKRHGFNLEGVKLPNKRQILRNCVEPEIGFHIFNAMLESKKGGDSG